MELSIEAWSDVKGGRKASYRSRDTSRADRLDRMPAQNTGARNEGARSEAMLSSSERSVPLSSLWA